VVIDGILNINKPAGLTSYGVVARVKRLTCVKKVGHAGTLDPFATGVLPVCLGKATRLVPYLAAVTKTYRADIEFGASTDTFDITGNVIQRGDCSIVTRDGLESALEQFRGDIQQTPPMYSALKYHGQPLYKLARAGINVERKSRPVSIFRLDIIDFESPLVTLEIECSKGTYIRSLAHDLGQALGCGAFLKSLARTGFGPFAIGDAISLEQLSDFEQFLVSVDFPLKSYRAVVIDEMAEKSMRQGGVFALDEAASMGKIESCRAYSIDGRFLGIVCYILDSGLWRSERLLG
jgi:tRNA pseudouridine55 synthase